MQNMAHNTKREEQDNLQGKMETLVLKNNETSYAYTTIIVYRHSYGAINFSIIILKHTLVDRISPFSGACSGGHITGTQVLLR
jgi:hypothetical protein